MRFFRTRVRREPVEWTVEDTAGRLGRALAQAGPHDERIGHRRTQAGNTDPSREGLALCASASRLRLAKPRKVSRA